MFRKTLLGVAIAAAAVQAYGHHSHSTIDKDWKIQFTGEITQYRWQSPHVYLRIESTKDDGSTAEYFIETLNPSSMGKTGWTKDTFKPGDKVVWAGNHDKDPDRAYASLDWVQKLGGYTYFVNEADMEAYLAENNIDEDTYLGLGEVKPATMIGEGTWSRVGENGGRFPPIRGPEDNWPYTDLAREQVASFSEDQNPLNVCDEAGIPKSTTAPLNFHLYMEGEDTIVIERDLQEEKRYIHLNADAPKGEPGIMGHSVGHYEGDVLVVETDNFVEDKWGLWSGVDSSDQKKMTERFWLSDDGMMLHVEMVVEDPVYLTEPVTIKHQWGKIADRPASQAECSMENATYWMTAGYEDEE